MPRKFPKKSGLSQQCAVKDKPPFTPIGKKLPGASEPAIDNPIPPSYEIGEIWRLFHDSRYAEMGEQARLLAEHDPQCGEAWRLLGIAWLMRQDYAQALAPLHQASALLPDHAEVWDHLGVVCQNLGELATAAACYKRCLALDPHRVQAWNNAADNAWRRGLLEESADYARQALALQPDYASPYLILGNVFRDLGCGEQAEITYRQALQLNPQFAKAHYNLGHLFQERGQYHDALGCYRQALKIQPDFVEAHRACGTALKDLGCFAEALSHYRTALALNPQLAETYGDFLFTLSHDENATPEEVFAAHAAFGQHFEAPLKAVSGPATHHARNPYKQLNVGFVSGDLCHHAVAYFIEPVWQALDRNQVAISAYSNRYLEDDQTARLKSLVDVWTPIFSLNDAALAERIRADQIDILIDLSGHTSRDRLLTFAHKPAPMQASWLGYPNTTGLTTMDYYLTDRYWAPPGILDALFTERLARLPCAFTFQPALGAPPVNPLPALTRGHITFASFHRPCKLGQRVIALWSEILKAVPHAILLIGAINDAALRDRLAEAFLRHGVTMERLAFYPQMKLQDYLALHHRVDIVLDAFPFSGGAVTQHALWMGVPVLTLTGLTPPHRHCAAMLHHVGLSDWVADSEEEYVDLARKWGADLPRLALLRTGLREQIEHSALRRPETVARGLEQAFRQMWRRWCAGLPPESFEVML